MMQEKMILCCCESNHEMRFWAENEERAKMLAVLLENRACLLCCAPVSVAVYDLPLPEEELFAALPPEELLERFRAARSRLVLKPPLEMPEV